jgi:hypothetical protein
MILIIWGWLLLAAASQAATVLETMDIIARQVANPAFFLDELEILGPASRDEAKIILLPEVHDDSLSLLNQLLVIAQEKQRGGRVIFLGESIPAFNKSPWELFSQKALSIAVAQLFREQYSPKRFEEELTNMALKLKSTPGQLIQKPSSGLWTLSAFSKESQSTILYGWDLEKSTSLTDRNIQLAQTIKKALLGHDRVIVMLGARHVPELEYLSSLKLLCPGHKIKSIEEFYARIKKKHGEKPRLIHGIGATAPLYDFLAQQDYAVIFNKNLYQKLDQAVISSNCLDLKIF